MNSDVIQSEVEQKSAKQNKTFLLFEKGINRLNCFRDENQLMLVSFLLHFFQKYFKSFLP